MSLDDLFAHPQESRSAQDVFTDRIEQRAAFATALGQLDENAGSAAVVIDFEAGRRNVLHFYGVGGIGKTTLSRHLQGVFTRRAGMRPTVSRVDFSVGADRDLENFIIRTRAALVASGVEWKSHAFDLAFAIYWSTRYPGRRLEEHLRSSDLLSRVASEVDLASELQESIEEVFDAATFGLGAVVRRGIQWSVARLRHEVRSRQAYADCPRFAQIVGHDDPTEMLLYLPYLLAWDLARAQRQALDDGEPVPHLLVLFDTWEEAQALSGHRGSIEDQFVRMMFLMPNVQFVVAGRDQLNWCRPEGEVQLAFGGARRWPGLETGPHVTSDQHLLGTLSSTDSRWYVEERLRIHGDLVPAAIIDRIVVEAHGLPYHLDLLVDLCTTAVAAGRRPEPSEFEGSFSMLVNRMLRGLPPAERNLLFAAATVPAFDDRMLAAMVPAALDTEVVRFLRRHLIRGPAIGWLPYSLHDTVRRAIQEAGSGATGDWDDGASAAARDRALASICTRIHAVATRNSGSGLDLRHMVSVAIPVVLQILDAGDATVPAEIVSVLRFGAAINLGGFARGWLDRAEAPPSPLCVLIATAFLREQADIREWIDHCEQVAAACTNDLLRDWFLVNNLAALYEIAGDLDAADAALDRVQNVSPVHFQFHAKRAGMRLRRSRTAECLELAHALHPPDSESYCAKHDLVGLARLEEADFAAADAEFTLVAARARSIGALLWEARSVRHLAITRVLAGETVPVDAINLALELNRTLNDEIGIIQATAASLAIERAGDPDALMSDMDALAHTLERRNARDDVSFVRLLEACAMARAGRIDLLRTRLAQPKVVSNYPARWWAMAGLAGLPDPSWVLAPVPSVPAQLVRQRWRHACGLEA